MKKSINVYNVPLIYYNVTKTQYKKKSKIIRSFLCYHYFVSAGHVCFHLKNILVKNKKTNPGTLLKENIFTFLFNLFHDEISFDPW